MLPSARVAASRNSDASAARPIAAAAPRATSSSGSGRSNSRRQRERMVGNSRAGAWLISSSSALRRRLLQNFQQRIGACGSCSSSTVSTMQTRQPPSPAVEPKNGTVRRTSSTRITVKSLPVFSLIDPLQHQQVGMPLRRDPPRAIGCSASPAMWRTLHRRGARIGMREHEARHAIGQRRLADARRPADQPGMVDTAAAIGLEQRPLGLVMAEQNGRLARMRGSARQRRHWRRSRRHALERTATVAGSSRSLTIFQMCSATPGVRRRHRSGRSGPARSSASSRKASRSRSWNASPSPRSGRRSPHPAASRLAPARPPPARRG